MTDEFVETSDIDRMLLDFVHGRDVECPLCGYNLRDLTKTTCPECGHSLELRVGVQQLGLLPFVLAIAPGIFSGACAAILAAMITVGSITNPGFLGGIPWQVIALDLFGWLSGALAAGIIVRRHKFLVQSRTTQRTIAGTIWTVHVMAFLALMTLVFG